MTQPGLTYTVDDLRVQKRLRQTLARLHNLKPVMENIGELGVRSIQENFKRGGRPGRWKGLSEATVAQRRKVGKWPGEILVRSGDLKKISSTASGKKVVLAPGDVPYAAIHQFGCRNAGRGRKVKIPARPYLLLQKEDGIEIVAMLADYAMEEGR